MKTLAQQIINEGLTKVSIERFEMINRHLHNITCLPGDIIECGVWKGGMGIYLSKLFSQKTIWLADSFKGFEDPTQSKYFYSGERHSKGGMSVEYEMVLKNLKKYECNNVNTLVGFVNETLPISPIKKYLCYA